MSTSWLEPCVTRPGSGPGHRGVCPGGNAERPTGPWACAEAGGATPTCRASQFDADAWEAVECEPEPEGGADGEDGVADFCDADVAGLELAQLEDAGLAPDVAATLVAGAEGDGGGGGDVAAPPWASSAEQRRLQGGPSGPDDAGASPPTSSPHASARSVLERLGLSRYADRLLLAGVLSAGALLALGDANLAELGLPMGPRRLVLSAAAEASGQASLERLEAATEATTASALHNAAVRGRAAPRPVRPPFGKDPVPSSAPLPLPPMTPSRALALPSHPFPSAPCPAAGCGRYFQAHH